MYILGIWDGHDAGAAILQGNKILVAINEERITRVKLYTGFPVNAIRACLDYAKVTPSDIHHVAITTSDFAKTLTRYIPSLKDRYYTFRRKQTAEPRFAYQMRDIKYLLTQIGPTKFTTWLTRLWFNKQLKSIGFQTYQLHVVEHHQAHAASTVFSSGMNNALVITIDGIGDGLSGSVSTFQNGQLKRISAISGKNSLGIFFEQVTNLLGMRELEDEGKVMALSDFAYPVDESKNSMLDFFHVDGINIIANYSVTKQYRFLKRIAWENKMEQFAYMAQQTLEKHILELVKNAIRKTGIQNVCWSGGVASNMKVNMKIRLESGLTNWFVFPHMGDGGLALGAAMQVNFDLHGVSNYDVTDVYFGTDYTDKEIERQLKKEHLAYSFEKNISTCVGDLVSSGNIVFWFQGRMEYGPRALGNRSILTLSSKKDVKDDLNRFIKKRSWFQPFCPSVLQEEAKRLFEHVDKPERFMTMGYMTKKGTRPFLEAVMNIDHSARPQMVGKENKKYEAVLRRVKKNTGCGAILNTSFNIHGHPIVMTPKDAIHDFQITTAHYLAIGNFLVKKT